MGEPPDPAAGEKPLATLVVTGVHACLTMAHGDPGPAAGADQAEVALHAAAAPQP